RYREDIFAAGQVNQVNGCADCHGRSPAVERSCHSGYSPGTPPYPSRFLGSRESAGVQSAIDGAGKQSLAIGGESQRFKAARGFCLLLVAWFDESHHLFPRGDVPHANERFWKV